MSQVEAAADLSPSSHAAAQGSRLSRRGLLTGAIAAVWAAAPKARAAQPNDVPADVDPGSLLTRLVRRCTFGPTPADLTLAASLGYHAYLEYQLNYQAIDDSACDARLANLTTLTMTQQQQYAIAASQLSNELTEATILRAVFSQRQLYERMVEFWTDHFSIDITKDVTNMLKSIDDRNVIRAHALGNFGDLLRASAHSPAMLTYLDNHTSTATAPNENYARELMELHSLGVDGGYTQEDVLQVCRCFSGWSYDSNSTVGNPPVPNPARGNFRYISGRHYNGAKTVFAGTPYQLNIPAGGGQQDGETVLNALIAHPNTARYVGMKMARWLLREDPSEALIDAVAAAYTATNGDIKSMIRVILRPNNLAAAPLKYKRPFHLVASALRALPCTVTATSGLRTQLNNCGHRPFYWGTPDGYPDSLLYWQGLILPRWNFGASLMHTSPITGVSVDFNTFFAGLTTAQQHADKLDQTLFAGEMHPADKAALVAFLGAGTVSSTKKRESIGVAIAAPGFQWY